MTRTNYRALCAELVPKYEELSRALDKVQDWDSTRVGDALDALEPVIEQITAALAAPPTLKEQALKALGPCPQPRPLWDADPGDPPCGVIGNTGEIERWELIRRALEADS